MPYTPSESMIALRYFYKTYGKKVFGEMGFYDAFNVTKNWFATSYLAIDQGPIIDMIENHRSGLLWKNFMKNPEIEPALAALGFVKDNSIATQDIDNQYDISIFPNPTRQGFFQVEMTLEKESNVSFSLCDVNGKEIKILSEKQAFSKGLHKQYFDNQELTGGFYLLKITINDTVIYKTLIFN
jgi:hypothetical protein